MAAVIACGQRSPTLSDAGMILPAVESDFAHTFSPAPYIHRPPSPPPFSGAYTTPYVELHSGPVRRQRLSQQLRPGSPSSAHSSRSTLRTMADSEPATDSPADSHTTLPSSPTVHRTSASLPSGFDTQQSQYRISSASSSTFGEYLDNWPAFDGNGAALEGEQSHGENATSQDGDIEQWSHEHRSGNGSGSSGGGGNGNGNGSEDDDDEDEDEDGPNSSAALSRRAEIILANAKKRLNDMEGNLRGARESLVVSPTFHFASSMTDVSHHISVTRERDRRLYAGMGPIPPRMYPYRSSLLSANGGSGHARGLSETSAVQPFTTSYASRIAANKRSSSAIGHTSGPWSAEGFGQGRFPVKESRSFEVLRDPRHNWSSTERENGSKSTSAASRSPTGLATLPEDEDASKAHRPSSAASGLREQMNDLKGRISSLKIKTQEDNVRRQSLRSLRTPSPFTSAEGWYEGSCAYPSGGSPITANAGLGIKTDTPSHEALFPDDGHDRSSVTTTTSQHDGENLVVGNTEERSHAEITQPHSHQDGEVKAIPSTEPETFEDEEVSEHNDSDCVSVDGNETEAEVDSVYEDAIHEAPATERHEDRVDAFDYENFFLHSAMGTYNLDGRRDSMSSDSSTATTRPVTALQTHDELAFAGKRMSMHRRSPSVQSMSTVASFATAAENQSEKEDEDETERNEEMDHFSQQILANSDLASMRSSLPNGGTFLRTDSAIYMKRVNGSSPPQTSSSRASSSSGDFDRGSQAAMIFSILTESSQGESWGALSEEEMRLIYELVASFQLVCTNLQSTHGGGYDRRGWRRRLDEARRVLNGEDLIADD